MGNPSFPRAALSDALSVILPTREETLLLRACLYSGDAARQAWKEWRSRTNGGANDYLVTDQSVKAILPLIFNALRCHGLELDKESTTFLRSAYLKEELRNKIFRRICRDVLLLLAKEDISAIVLKGTALAETVYPSPVLRHSHDIEILLKDQDLDRAAATLRRVFFRIVKQGPEPGGSHFTLEHETHLPLELHSSLFQIPYYNSSLAEIWSRRRKCEVADVPAHILAPSDNLLHVCGHASYSRGHQSLRWVNDAWFVIDRNPDLDWDLLLDCAGRSHLVLPLSVILSYLAEDLKAAVPQDFLHRLSAAASESSAVEREFALFSARSAPLGSFRSLLRKTNSWRGRAFVIRWMLFPSPTYLRWVQQNHRSWLLPFYYVYRPISYVGRRIGSAFKESVERIRFLKKRRALLRNNRVTIIRVDEHKE